MATPTYLRSSPVRLEQRGTTFTVNEVFGYDEATVRFKVRAIKFQIDQAVEAHPKGSTFSSDTLGSYDKLFKLSHRVMADGPWATVEVKYIGSVSGSAVDAIIGDDTNTQSATLSTDSEADPPVEVLYRTQTRVARYFRFTQPTAPEYKGVSGNNQQFTPFDHNPPLSKLDGTLDFAFTLTTVRFHVENLVTDKMWRVTEEHGMRIHDKDEDTVPDL